MFDYLPSAGVLHLIATFVSVRLLLFSFVISVFGSRHLARLRAVGTLLE